MLQHGSSDSGRGQDYITEANRSFYLESQTPTWTADTETPCFKVSTSERKPCTFPKASFMISRVIIRDKNVHYVFECFQ